MHHSMLFIQSPTTGHFGCFQVLAMVSIAAINICVKMDIVFCPFGSMPSSAAAGSYGKNRFSFVRYSQTVFRDAYTILLSHKQRMKVPVVLHPCQHLVLSVFCIVAFLMGVQWCCGNFHFPSDIWCWVSFHVLICNLCIFFDEVFKCFLKVF